MGRAYDEEYERELARLDAYEDRHGERDRQLRRSRRVWSVFFQNVWMFVVAFILILFLGIIYASLTGG